MTPSAPAEKLLLGNTTTLPLASSQPAVQRGRQVCVGIRMRDVPSEESRRAELTRTLAEHRDRFVAFVEGSLRDRATAEDVVQATFARALSRVTDLRDDEALVAWFFRALRNAVVDHHRRLGTADRALARWAAEAEATTPATPPDASLVCGCVRAVATSLKPEYAEALQRIEVDGAAVRDFAVERGISRSNAAVRVFRAREALRRGVIAKCGDCAAGGCVDCRCRGAVSKSVAPA